MSSRDKMLCPIRLYESDYEQIKKLASQDGLSFQKVAEILLINYIKDNRAISTVVKKYAEEKKARKGRRLDETETSYVFERIENESPIKDLEGR